MFFASDNWSGAHPAIAASLVEHASGFASAYGGSDLDKAVQQRFSELFERDVAVFFVGTGTAANSLSLASAVRPGGVIFASSVAHIYTDEAGAPEYLSGGGRVRPIAGPPGKLDPRLLSEALAMFDGASVHAGQPSAVSITQATEAGTLYGLDEIAAIAEIARTRGLALHMDGARFANGLVSLGCKPAETTWKSGVDMLSFGGTKNGCWCAEAVVFFDPQKARDFPFLRMRAGHLHSKSRFIAAQFGAYLKDDLWLENARHANAMTTKLAQVMEASGDIRLAWQPQANEIFAVMPRETMRRLQDGGAKFYDWHSPTGQDVVIPDGHLLTRFVTSFATTHAHVEMFADLLKR